MTCPPNVDGCIPDSKCTSCHSTCAPGSCMSKSPGQCSDEDCTACPAGSYLLPRVVHAYDGVQQFSEVSAAAKAKKSIEDPAQADLPQMQRLYAFKTGLRLPVSGMCNACPGSESGCKECQIVGPSGSGVRSWRCVHPPGAFDHDMLAMISSLVCRSQKVPAQRLPGPPPWGCGTNIRVQRVGGGIRAQRNSRYCVCELRRRKSCRWRVLCACQRLHTITRESKDHRLLSLDKLPLAGLRRDQNRQEIRRMCRGSG